MNTPLPGLFITHLREMSPRLSDEEVLRTAVVIEETPAALADPRLTGALLLLIYAPRAPRLLLLWPDGALGFAYFPAGSQPTATLLAEYAAARGWLEEFHMQHAMPAGEHH